MEHVLGAVATVFMPEHLVAMTLGLTAGLIFGALPGLTTTMGTALFVPLTYSYEPLVAFLFLLGLYCGGVFGGSICAILVSTPGTPASVVTMIDGYPMTRQGRAGEALSTAIVASAVGGLMSGAMLIFIAPQLARFGLRFGPHEYFALGFLGLSVIVSVAGDSLVRGITAGLLGLLLSTIGMDQLLGYPRYVFGEMELFDGLPFIPVMIGLFAFSEVLNGIEELSSGKPVAAQVIKSLGLAWSRLRRMVVTMIKSGVIGTFVGILPGAGAAIASLLAYNEAKRSSKTPERFGKGALEGAAASESANNGVTGGSLIPLLTLGIPGDTVTAILLGAFLLHGYTVGPLFFRDHPDVFYKIGIGLLVINLIMIVIGVIAAKYLATILRVPRRILYPSIFVLTVVGAFAPNTSMFDVGVMIVCGAAGYLFQKSRIPLMPIVLGLILGPMIEVNFRHSLVMGPPSMFLTQPISAVLLLMGTISLALAVRRALREPPPAHDIQR